jgi:nucleotide-binding universal stress UspA family protein
VRWPGAEAIIAAAADYAVELIVMGARDNSNLQAIGQLERPDQRA